MRRVDPGCLAFLLSSFLGCAGCGACEPDRTAGTHAADLGPTAADSHVVPPPVGLGPRSAALPCRALTVEGSAQYQGQDGELALADKAPIPQVGWLRLSAGARLVVKDPRTARETTFRGPALARACVELGEESWLASGAFESTLGTGETPGAEEWVITPLGVVRFGAAKLIIEVARPEVRIRVAAGPVFVWTAGDASGRGLEGGTPKPAESDEGWLRIAAGGAIWAPTASLPAVTAAHAAVEACQALAKNAHELAAALLEPDADPLVAMRQVSTRRLARAACAVAALRVDALSPADSPDGPGALSTTLKEAAALWRSLPLR